MLFDTTILIHKVMRFIFMCGLPGHNGSKCLIFFETNKNRHRIFLLQEYSVTFKQGIRLKKHILDQKQKMELKEKYVF